MCRKPTRRAASAVLSGIGMKSHIQIHMITVEFRSFIVFFRAETLAH